MGVTQLTKKSSFALIDLNYNTKAERYMQKPNCIINVIPKFQLNFRRFQNKSQERIST